MDEERLNCGSETPEEPEVLPVVDAEAEIIEEATEDPAAADTGAENESGSTDAQPEVTLEEVLESMSGETPETDEASTEETPVADKPVKTKKLKWWYIAVPAVLLIAILAAIFWRPIWIHVAPKAALAQALVKTGEALTARNEGTPLVMMSNAYDETGRNTVEMSVDAQLGSGIIDDFRIDMTIMADAKTRQNQIAANVDVAGESVGLNMYIDPDMMALNLEQFTGETYLGIVYDTFGENMRKNDFLYSVIGEDTLQELEQYIQVIDDTLSREPVTDEQMKASLEAYGQLMLDFIGQKDAAVSKEDVSLDGSNQSCYAIAFTISEKELGELYEQVIDAAAEDPVAEYYYISYNYDPDGPDWEEYLEDFREDAEELKSNGEGQCEIVFYLYKDQVAMVEMDYVSEGMDNDGEWVVSLNFGENAAESNIIYSYKTAEGESGTLTLSTEKDGNEIHERLVLVTSNDDGEDDETTFGYDWNRKSGAFTLFMQTNDPEEEADKFELKGTLLEEKNGYSLSFPDIMETFSEVLEEDMDEHVDMSLELKVSAGAEIETPEITDITGLSRMDLFRMLSKVMDI